MSGEFEVLQYSHRGCGLVQRVEVKSGHAGLQQFFTLPGAVFDAKFGGCRVVRPDRSLRLCGLATMGVCLPKLFLYDLRHLETPYRILSFVLLGMLLIAASWIYTRYKSRLHGFIEGA